MKTTPINEAFGSALSFAFKRGGRGFQARVSIESGVDPGNISAMKRLGKGSSEEVRRLVLSKIIELNPDFPAKTYEDFLSIGRWILDGNNPEDWKPPVRGEISAKLPAFKATVGATSTEPSNISLPPRGKYAPMMVPVISLVQAGDWNEVNDPFPPGYAEEYESVTCTNHPNAFALKVEGSSMEPEYHEGDIIIVDPGRAYGSGSLVIAKNGEEATFKKIVIEGKRVTLEPLNPRHDIKDMTGIEFRVIGVVVERRTKVC